MGLEGEGGRDGMRREGGREGLDEARYVHALLLSGVGVTEVLKWDVMSIKRLWVKGMDGSGENECGGGDTFKGDQGGWGSRGVLVDGIIVASGL